MAQPTRKQTVKQPQQVPEWYTKFLWAFRIPFQNYLFPKAHPSVRGVEQIPHNLFEKVNQGKLTAAEVQHFKRMGIALPVIKKREIRYLRRFANWWETTPCEKLLEDIVYLLKNASVLDIINMVASITIILSLFNWWAGRQTRQEEELFSTWSVIKNASGDQSGVARVAAERLNRNGFSLAGLDLEKTHLWKANLQGADLYGTNLQGANLLQANMLEATLTGANLAYSHSWNVNLQGADLENANLQRANLEGANLLQANLQGANLQGAILEGNTNLKEANLQGANLLQAELTNVNFQETINLTQEQLAEALLCRTTLPGNITLDPNRDCEALRIDPETGVWLGS